MEGGEGCGESRGLNSFTYFMGGIDYGFNGWRKGLFFTSY